MAFVVALSVMSATLAASVVVATMNAKVLEARKVCRIPTRDC